MATLLDLLSPYPVLENLVSVLPRGDLFNLCKTNSRFRAALHGFQVPITMGGRTKGKSPATRPLRSSLRIGEHDTAYWKNLKARSALLCSEPHHTRGHKIRGCLMCSMPVCEACIIKASFGKRNENTFQSRTRSLCTECYDSGKPHKAESLLGFEKQICPPLFRRAEWNCICTAKDGHLCLRCKTEQKQLDIDQCFGEGCSETKTGGFPARVCLWCDLRLPGERSRAEARRDYDKRHLLARNHSSYERLPEDDDLDDPATQRAMWESSSPSASSGHTSGTRKAKVPNYDHLEDERKRELDAVSTNRLLTATAAEDERWSRAELLRRGDLMFYPPPPTPVPKKEVGFQVGGSSGEAHSEDSEGRNGPFPAAGSLTWHRLDSTASTLLQGADESPPTYDSCTDNDIAKHHEFSSSSKS